MAETSVAKIEKQNDTGLVVRDPSAIAAAESARARIESAYTVAMRKPRNEDDARLKILEACRRPMFAARVEYAKPTGGKAIKGPSVRLAELCIRLWGNILVETTVVYEETDTRRVNVRVIDVETNATFSRDISVKKVVERKFAKDRDVISSRQNSYGDQVFVVKATDDEVSIEESKAVSKIVRNEGLRLIPSDIIDEAIAVARETLAKKDAEDPDAARKRVIDAFAGIGVRPTDLATFLGHPVAQLVPAELETLRALHRAIADEETTWVAIMDAKKEKEKGRDGAEDGDAGAGGGKDQGKKISERLKKTGAAAAPATDPPATSPTAPAVAPDGKPDAKTLPVVTDEEQALVDACYAVGTELGYTENAMDTKIDSAQANGIPALKSLLAGWKELAKVKK